MLFIAKNGTVLVIRYLFLQESTLTLHNGFIVVFLFALGDATLWYAAYQDINLTGQPYCCPLPSHVVGAFVLQVFRYPNNQQNYTILKILNQHGQVYHFFVTY